MCWRYMDLAKFANLLQTRALNFCRLDKFSDPFEGSTTPANAEAERAWEAQLKDKAERGQAYQKVTEVFSQSRVLQRKKVFANCWHLGSHESEAMWELYSHSNQGVCITARYQKLAEHLPSDVYLGRVKYIDYETESFPLGNVLYPTMHKRISFKHENEVRAVIWALGDNSKHRISNTEVDVTALQQEVDLDDLLEDIRVHPASSNWFKHTVEGLVQQYQLKKPVIQSALSNSPIF